MHIGAGLALWPAPLPTQPYRVNVSLAILGLINLGDTDAQHKMTVELVYVDGRNETRVPLADELPEGNDPADRGMFIAYFVAPRSAQMFPGDEWSMPMAIPMFGLGLPELGSYYFSVRVDGREMDRAAFRLMPPRLHRPPTAGGPEPGHPAISWARGPPL